MDTAARVLVVNFMLNINRRRVIIGEGVCVGDVCFFCVMKLDRSKEACVCRCTLSAREPSPTQPPLICHSKVEGIFGFCNERSFGS